MTSKITNRKIAVELVADVVGYSKHMEKNEDATLVNYSECEKIFKSLFKNNIHTSKKLISSVIAQRSIKAPEEILEIESALEITAEMHKIAMQNSSDGVTEQSVVGKMEGYALSLSLIHI